MSRRALLIVALVLCTPLAAANDDVVSDARISYVIPLDGASVVEADIETSQLPTEPGCRQTAPITPGPGTSFSFSETDEQTACGEGRLTLPVPPGARTLTVGFMAERTINHAMLALSIDALQDLRLYDQDGNNRSTADYLPAETANVTPARFFEEDFPVLLGAKTIILGWHFHDRGTTTGQRLGLVTSGQSFSSTISNITASFPDVRIDGHNATTTLGLTTNTTQVFDTRVTMDVPHPTISASASLTLQVAAKYSLTGIERPDGSLLPLTMIPTPALGAALTIHLPAEAIDGRFGQYVFHFTSSEALPVPQSTLPGTLPWLPWATGSLPVVGLALAAPALGVRRSSSYAARIAWRNMWSVVGIAAAICLGAGAVALFTLPSGDLTLIKAPIAAVMVHTQWIIGGLVMLAVAVVGSRQMRRAFAEETEREKSEREAMARINEELERFAYVASHDLQEPLRKVISLTQLVQKRYKGKLDADADDYLGFAAESAQRMRVLVQDLLRYSRLQHETPQPTRLSISDTLDAVAGDLEIPMNETRAELRFDAMPDLEGDPGQFRQVMQNLVSNAIKYAHATRAPVIDVSARLEGTMVHVQVKDNGMGIAPRHQDKVFEVFQRLHSQREIQGTGIGLSLVRKIIEKHGGKIWLESTLDVGSTFHFLWPRGHGP